MPTVLEEFLVSVRYAKDAASEQNLLESLKKIGGSVAGVAAAIVGLGVAIFKLTEHFADIGDAAYHLSSRLGSTVADIQATTYAMTAFGVSTEEAKGALEGMGNFTRSYGPIATQFMGQLGITATDTEGRMRQLGEFLRRQGFAPGKEGTMGYAMGLRWGHILAPGASEQALRGLADPEFAKTLEEAHKIQRNVFGIQGEGPEAEAQRSHALDAMAAQAHKMSLLLADFGFMFNAIMSVFSSKLFTALQPQFEHLFKTLNGWLPTINAAFGVLADVLGVVMGAFNSLLDALNWVGEAISPLVGQIDGLGVALGVLGAAFLATPIGAFIALVLYLFLILDDFKRYQKGEDYALNWDALEAPFKKFHDALCAIQRTIEGWQQAIREFFQHLDAKIKEAQAAVRQFFIDMWNDAVEYGGKLGGWIDGVTSKITGWGVEALKFFEKLAGFKPEEGKGVLDYVQTVWDWLDKWNKKLGEVSGQKVEFGWFGDTVKAITDLVKSVTGLDVSKTDSIIKWFADLAKFGDPREQVAAAWKAFVDTIARLVGMFSGESGKKSVIDWMGELVNKLSISTQIKETWEAIANAIQKIADAYNELPTWMGGKGGATDGATTDPGGPTVGPPANPVLGTAAQLGMRDQLQETFKRYGMNISTEDADAMMSSFLQESNFDPTAVNEKSGARGLPNWMPARWGPLADWAQKQGIDPNTREGQMAMIAHEVQTNPAFRRMLFMMSQTDDPMEKRKIFFRWYEAGIGSGNDTAEELRKHSRWFPPGRAPTPAPAPIVPPHVSGAGPTPAAARGDVSMNNDTDIHVYGSSDPVATAHAIGDHQERVVMNTFRLGRQSYA